MGRGRGRGRESGVSVDGDRLDEGLAVVDLRLAAGRVGGGGQVFEEDFRDVGLVVAIKAGGLQVRVDRLLQGTLGIAGLGVGLELPQVGQFIRCRLGSRAVGQVFLESVQEVLAVLP